MKIGITCYPTYGGSGAVATELGMELALLPMVESAFNPMAYSRAHSYNFV